MTRILFVVAFLALLLSLSAGPVLACHMHHLETPGMYVENIAQGQTSKEEGEGGYHQFHNNVHKGIPGTQAFLNPNNPVEVFGDPFQATCDG